jgi:hypothetical protein
MTARKVLILASLALIPLLAVIVKRRSGKEPLVAI